MKAKLIIDLIRAHSSSNENEFENALFRLVKDEEKKGNISLSSSIRNAYSPRKSINKIDKSITSSMTLSGQSIVSVPRDKDTALDLLEIEKPTVRLSDVVLSSATKEMLNQIIEEQKQADSLLKKGITPTNRVLFCGPPGCGKTMTANALAGELGMELAYVRLDALVSSYLGQTGSNIRKIFDFVNNKKIMLFLDEFDAVAKKRDDAHELGELKRVVTSLLQNLDQMPTSVFLVAATNHQHLLDPAIWRRFDVSILMELPDEDQREKIINKEIKKYFKNYLIDSKIIAKLSSGMSGAQLCTYMGSLAKYFFMKKEKQDHVSYDDIASIWLKRETLFVQNNSDYFNRKLLDLKNSGIPIRTLENVTGIPKSTLSYRFNKGGKE